MFTVVRTVLLAVVNIAVLVGVFSEVVVNTVGVKFTRTVTMRANTVGATTADCIGVFLVAFGTRDAVELVRVLPRLIFVVVKTAVVRGSQMLSNVVFHLLTVRISASKRGIVGLNECNGFIHWNNTVAATKTATCGAVAHPMLLVAVHVKGLTLN